jgi:hypothetical protein
VIGYEMNDNENILARRNKFNSQVNDLLDLLCFSHASALAQGNVV